MNCLLFYKTRRERDWEKRNASHNKGKYLSLNDHAKCQWSVSFPHSNTAIPLFGDIMCIGASSETQRNDTFNFIVIVVVVVVVNDADSSSLFLNNMPFFFSIAIFWHKYSNKMKKQWKINPCSRAIKCRLVFKAISPVYCFYARLSSYTNTYQGPAAQTCRDQEKKRIVMVVGPLWIKHLSYQRQKKRHHPNRTLNVMQCNALCVGLSAVWCECVCMLLCTRVVIFLSSRLSLNHLFIMFVRFFFLPLCAFMLNSIGAQCIPSSFLADALRVLCACIGVKNATLIRCTNKKKHWLY